jgi:phosphoketolase
VTLNSLPTSSSVRARPSSKKAEVIRVYLPPDANTLLSVADHCLRSRN